MILFHVDKGLVQRVGDLNLVFRIGAADVVPAVARAWIGGEIAKGAQTLGLCGIDFCLLGLGSSSPGVKGIQLRFHGIGHGF